MTEEELHPSFPLTQSLKLASIISRLEELLGITLSQRVKKSIVGNVSRTVAMVSDIDSYAKIKTTNLIDLASAKALSYQAAIYKVYRKIPMKMVLPRKRKKMKRIVKVYIMKPRKFSGK